MDLGIITVDYQSTNDVEQARLWLEELDKKPLLGCDFELAVKYTEDDRKRLKDIANDKKMSHVERKQATAALSATALDHPAHSVFTHCSIAWSDKQAYVFILDSFDITRLVLQFLINTEVRQIWFNASYDFLRLYYHTGKMPKLYEDAQIYARVLFNHVDSNRFKFSLKSLAGNAYGDWGLSADYFDLSQIYNPTMIKYAAVDACATLWVWDRILTNTEDAGLNWPETNTDYTPWSQLPAPSPKGAEYTESYFYHNSAKFFIRDTVRLMNNGVPISLDEVRNLEKELVTILGEVNGNIADNALMKLFLRHYNEQVFDKFKESQRKKMRSAADYLKEFDSKNIEHRSYFMYLFSQEANLPMPAVPEGQRIPKWTAVLTKKLATAYPSLRILVDHTVPADHRLALAAMDLRAQHKAEDYNQYYVDRINQTLDSFIETSSLALKAFNPRSSKQKLNFFGWLGIESEAQSDKTGDDSWNREQIERVHNSVDDEDLVAVTGEFIEHSYAAIVKSNFIEAFYRCTVDGVLYGTYNLLGAKTGRYTSKNPNMLNMPSSGSKFAKPVKRCFIAPDGYIIAAIDYAALEDRVMANLSEDENKLAVFTQGLDGHCLASNFYHPDLVSQYLPEGLETTEERVKEFKRLVDEGHAELKDIRNGDKKISFGLAYGCGPAKVATAVKGEYADGKRLYDAYHNELYPKITEYRENYVLKSAIERGYLHMGLGFRIYSDRPSNDIRTLANSTCQFWSVLSLMTINRLHYEIDKSNLDDDIKIISSIYDSIYFIIKDDPETIKWLNDKIVPIMEKDFMEGQIVGNSVDLEIGPNWADLHQLPHNASVEQIKEVRNKWT